jgi:hypothetical protein
MIMVRINRSVDVNNTISLNKKIVCQANNLFKHAQLFYNQINSNYIDTVLQHKTKFLIYLQRMPQRGHEPFRRNARQNVR